MPSAEPPTSEAPRDAESDLSYEKRLSGDKAPAETLSAATEPAPKAPDVSAPAPAPEASGTPVATATPPATAVKTAEPLRAAPPPPAAAPSAGPRPGVWAVQVVALTDRAAATAVMQRLTSKGYHAFLVAPQSGAPVQNYKVQVGKFEDRSQAEQIASRLKKEEQFQPWILR
jgi:cell division septation protein DedD